MPLGIVDSSTFEKEVGNCDLDIGLPIPVKPSINIDSIFNNKDKDKELGRGKGNIEVPNILRQVIAGEAIEGGDVSDIATAFKVSRSSISSYMNGSHSCASYDKIDGKLANHNNEVRNKIVRMTRGKVKRAVRMLTDDKLASCNAVQLASVARQMSQIAVENEPEVKHEEMSKTVVIYRPRIREEDTFDIISVTE